MELTQLLGLAVMLLFVAALVKANRRRSSGRSRPGPGTTGTIYDLLNEDKRRAIEIIVEERAEEREPETADGNLPELESPGNRS